MTKSLQVLAVCLAVCTGLGCRQEVADSSGEATNEASRGDIAREDFAQQQLPAGLTQATPPDHIVTAFLNALRSGDRGVAEALLTRRAREETRKRDLTVQPLGSPDATFSVGPVEYLDRQQRGAHVNTRWTEVNTGVVINYDIIWALRRYDVGWRVAGMGAQLGPGQPVVYLNFEDPDDMLAKWREADDAVAAAEAADPGIRQAQVPSGSYR